MPPNCRLHDRSTDYHMKHTIAVPFLARNGALVSVCGLLELVLLVSVSGWGETWAIEKRISREYGTPH
jgi:hypothetical protein